MKTEQNFEVKETDRQKLVALIKEKGLTDPQAIVLFNEWSKEQEKKAEQFIDREYIEKQIELDFEKAQIYFEAGYTDEALEEFNQVLDRCEQENMEELFHRIFAKAAELNKSINK